MNPEMSELTLENSAYFFLTALLITFFWSVKLKLRGKELWYIVCVSDK